MERTEKIQTISYGYMYNEVWTWCIPAIWTYNFVLSEKITEKENLIFEIESP